MSFYTTENIPYQEYRAISDLVHAHLDAHDGRVRAVIVFGSLVAGGQSQDINLLEVVEGWDGLRHATFGSTPAISLRGEMNLYFLRPSEFENPNAGAVPGEEWSSAELLSRVREAYAILLENPNNYAFNVMARLNEAPRVETSRRRDEDPISFIRDRALQRA